MGRDRVPSPGARAEFWADLVAKHPEFERLADVPAPMVDVQQLRVSLVCSHGRESAFDRLGTWTATRVGDRLVNAEHVGGGTVFVRPGPGALDGRTSWSAQCRRCGADYSFRWATLAAWPGLLAARPGYGVTMFDPLRVTVDLWRVQRGR